MKFTDVEVMSFVDEDCDAELKKNIEVQLRNDPDLTARIETFQLANNAMSELIQKETEMPRELFEELKTLRMSNPEMKKKTQNFPGKL